MVQGYLEISMGVIGVGLVLVAAGFWTGSGVATRPKHSDEQTLIGGTIWSQIIIPTGLMISRMLDESIDVFIEGYYMISGTVLLGVTGIVLVVRETKRLRKIKRRRMRQLQLKMQTESQLNLSAPNIESKMILNPSKINFSIDSLTGSIEGYDRSYYEIGIVCIVAAILKLCEFIIFAVLDTQTV